MFRSLKILQLERDISKFKGLKPKLPSSTQLEMDIVNGVKNLGCVIGGSYALRAYKPYYTAKDIDIVCQRKKEYADRLVQILNKKYPNRFYAHKSFNVYRIYDSHRGVYVVDVATYPITSNDYTIVNGVKVAKPSYVIRGKIRREKTYRSKFW